MAFMSVIVREVLSSIKTNPGNWVPVKNSYRWSGIREGNVTVNGFGNTRPLSVLDLKVHSKDVTISYIETWALEGALIWWYKNCPLEKLENGEDLRS